MQQFDIEHLNTYIASSQEMDNKDLDLIVLGQLAALTTISAQQQQHTRFYHRGKIICLKVFCFLHVMSRQRLVNLQSHFREEGISPRRHGNENRLPSNVTPHESVCEVKQYIHNYALDHGLFLPGRVPGHRANNDETVFLPSHLSKASVHREYKLACESAKLPVVSSRIFNDIWNTFLPNIKIIDPRSDLCFQCEQNSNLIVHSSNTDNTSKKEALSTQQQHLIDADLESHDYKCRIEQARFTYSNNEQIDYTLSKKLPNSAKLVSVYSFDFAQQVQYPSNPDQPGAIYFKVPRKIALFGINNEAINRQTNYLIDEAVDTGKGANTVISYLHHYFENYGFGEEIAHLQADNCCGQNKNNAMLQYLCWRTLNGFHDHITINFMIAGHTKFSVDRNFGAIKRKYKRTYCSSLFEVADVVNTSTEVGSNIHQLVGLPNGQVIVKVYDWSKLFSSLRFKILPNITKYHHFRFSKDKPGVAFVRELAHSDEIKIKILDDINVPVLRMPLQIIPKGLSAERKKYLFKEIRRFCKNGTEDLVAPEP